MTPAEVYDQACALLGPAAAVVQLGPLRWVVGTWRRLGAGELPEGLGGPILRSEVWGLVVEGIESRETASQLATRSRSSRGERTSDDTARSTRSARTPKPSVGGCAVEVVRL